MIETTFHEGIAVLRMLHGKVNAMSLEFLQAFSQRLDEVRVNYEASMLIITGNDRVFSAGVDLKRLTSEGPEYLDQFLPELTAMFLKVFEFPKPVIAAINGPAVAGGCVLACAADYRVISKRATIGVPELRVGVPFPSSGMEIMRWSATRQAFRKIINTGATFQGEAAVVAGLADEAAKHEFVLDIAKQASEPFAVVPPRVFELTKRQMRLPVLDRIRRSEEAFGADIRQLWKDDETRRAVTEYVESRLG